MIVTTMTLTSTNSFTVLSTTIKGRLIKCTTPFLTGILALTISATTDPVGCIPSKFKVSLLTKSTHKKIIYSQNYSKRIKQHRMVK